jgi:hypothetical protein
VAVYEDGSVIEMATIGREGVRAQAVAAASALAWAAAAALAGGVAAAGVEATGAGGAVVDTGAVGRTKLRFGPTLINRLSVLRKQARLGNCHYSCAVRRGLGRGRDARGLGISSSQACPFSSAPRLATWRVRLTALQPFRAKARKPVLSPM